MSRPDFTHSTSPSPRSHWGTVVSRVLGRREALSGSGVPFLRSSEFSLGIHGARGLFAFAVLVYHVANSGLPTFALPAIVTEGLHSLKFGVELFFAISGFVIAGTLSRSRTPLLFLAGRATRIYPVLWAVLLVYLPVSLVGGVERSIGFSAGELVWVTLASMLALGPLLPVPVLYGAAWTLSFEFGFYALCFLFLVARRRFPRHETAILALVVILGLAVALWQPRALFFLSGVIVSAGLLRDTPLAPLSRLPLVWTLVFLAAWQGAAEPAAPFFAALPQWGDPVRYALAVVAFVAATLAIEGIARGHGRFSAFLQTGPMLWLGTISYSLYLWHPLVLGVVKAGMRQLGLVAMAGPASQLLFLLLVVPPTLVLAHFSQRFLEEAATRRLRAWLR